MITEAVRTYDHTLLQKLNLTVRLSCKAPITFCM